MLFVPSAVFIHFHKSGGQFINRLLLRHIPDSESIGYHLPRSETPPTLTGLPSFGFVRNPWDWYVSWYAFNILNPLRNPIFRAVSVNGTLNFKTSMENLLKLGQPDFRPMRESIAKGLPVTRESNLGSGITAATLLNMDESERGYLSWLWRYMFLCQGAFDGVTFGRFENLRSEIVRLLEGFGISIPDEMIEAIQAAPAVNTSPHQHYRNYYDRELRNLVAIKDREYMQMFDYRF